MTKTKICPGCGEEKPHTIEFFRRAKDGSVMRGQCKKCHAEAAREWRKRNPEKKREQNRRRYQREKKGGIRYRQGILDKVKSRVNEEEFEYLRRLLRV